MFNVFAPHVRHHTSVLACNDISFQCLLLIQHTVRCLDAISHAHYRLHAAFQAHHWTVSSCWIVMQKHQTRMHFHQAARIPQLQIGKPTLHLPTRPKASVKTANKVTLTYWLNSLMTPHRMLPLVRLPQQLPTSLMQLPQQLPRLLTATQTGQAPSRIN